MPECLLIMILTGYTARREGDAKASEEAVSNLDTDRICRVLRALHRHVYKQWIMASSFVLIDAEGFRKSFRRNCH